MDTPRLLHQMCHEILSEADLRVIGKARGFTVQQASSRDLFENIYLTPQGLENVMSSLTSEEVAVLHVLHFTGETVGISFFERLYGEPQRRSYGTVTQRYKGVLEAVKSNLVRKGVLLMGELQASAPLPKMERWRFQFPALFAGYLPTVFREVVRLNGTGSVQTDGFREHLMQIMKATPAATRRNKQYELHLAQGSLMIDQQPFSVQAMEAWQRAGWEAEVIKQSTPPRRGWLGDQRVGYGGYPTLNPIEKKSSWVLAVVYALSQLQVGEWVLPEMLTGFLKMVFNHRDDVSPEKICEIGWKWGCLAGIEQGQQRYYRLPDRQTATLDPADYLTLQPDGVILIDLLKIPYESLELLEQVAVLKTAANHLRAIPSIAKIGEAPPTRIQQPLIDWLAQHSAAFQKALETAEKRWGKVLVHENVMVARVTDLSLRVKVQKAFEQQVVLIGEEWLVFPVSLTGEMEKMIKKAGHVIKWVENE